MKVRPDLEHLVPEGSTVTRLTGTFRPAQMREDILPQWGAGGPYRKAVFSRQGALETAAVVAYSLAMLGVFAILLTGFRKRPLGPTRGLRAYARRVLLPLGAAVLAVAVLTYAVLPKIATRTDDRWRGLSRPADCVLAALVRFAAPREPAARTIPVTADDLRAAIRTEMRLRLEWHADGRPLPDPSVGEPVPEEDSPGNYTIEETPEQLLVRVYDDRGMVTEYTVPR